jgi:hypothetical protein
MSGYTKAPEEALEQILARQLATPCPESVLCFAQQLAQRFKSAQAIIFYGSALRTGAIETNLLDFYVLVGAYQQAHNHVLAACANALLPPNVYYCESTGAGKSLRAKVAVLSLADFAKRHDIKSLDVSIWARFAQPSALVWVQDEPTRHRIAQILAKAVVTALLSAPRPKTTHQQAELWWAQVFANTYGCELRAERGHKPQEIVQMFADYYAQITPAAQCLINGPPPTDAWWARRKALGRVIHILRLLKAAFTFAGGMDYLAWKIERHSGQKVMLKPWHRRFPLIAGPWLAWQLKRRGAIR